MKIAWTLVSCQLLIYSIAWAAAALLIRKFQDSSRALAISATCFAVSLIVPAFSGDFLDENVLSALSNLLRIQGFLYIGNASAYFFGMKPIRQVNSWWISIALDLLIETLNGIPSFAGTRQMLVGFCNGIILGLSFTRIHRPFAREFGARNAWALLGCGYLLSGFLVARGLAAAMTDRIVPIDIDFPETVNHLLVLALLIGDGVLYMSAAVLVGIRLVRETAEISLRDPLTNLFNRRGLERAYKSIQMHFRRNGRGYSLAMLDIDHFKRINDTLGHAAGDHVLQEISRNLCNTLRATDIPARIGGEEFVILLPETSQTEAMHSAERIRKVITTSPCIWNGKPVNVTVSMGISSATSSSDELSTLLEKSDAALYQAKNEGRNRVICAP